MSSLAFEIWKVQLINNPGVPLAPEDITLPAVDVENSFRAGDGLFQVMSDAVIRGGRSGKGPPTL